MLKYLITKTKMSTRNKIFIAATVFVLISLFSANLYKTQQTGAKGGDDPVCGDGVLGGHEQCDDGELNSDVNPDACRTTCILPACGDSVTDTGGGETCDDGNFIDGDGCSSFCLIETEYCGNGIVDGAESCDDGNTDNGDGCSSVCELEWICGNNIVDPGEECDLGNKGNSDTAPDTCRTSCLFAYCGDGVEDTGEACDDGNSNNGDGCSSTCTVETGPVCNWNNELVANTGFENVIVAGDWDVVSNGTANLGWNVEWYSTETDYQGTPRPATANLEVRKDGLAVEGNQYVELDSDWEGPGGTLEGEPSSVRIYQDIETVPGQNYTVSFYTSPNPNITGDDNILDFIWNNSVSGSITRNDSSITDWSQHTYVVKAAGTPTRLEFFDGGTPDSAGVLLDYVSVRCGGVARAVCGNGIIEKGEDCDDGNLDDNDACPASCRFPHGADVTTIYAHKIVCDKESDLPNWGNGGPDITSGTAAGFIGTHPSCHLQEGFSFQWAYPNASNPGDNVGIASGWNTFGPTNSSGMAVTNAFNITSSELIWLREAANSGYIPFTGEGGSNVSAEFYCNKDVVHYDNYDFISYPQNKAKYYCIAFNVAKGCGNEVIDSGEECDDGNTSDNDGCSAICEIEGGLECTDADEDGYAIEGGECGDLDCNDNDSSTNPGAEEVCGDGTDNNCNGEVDENCAVGYGEKYATLATLINLNPAYNKSVGWVNTAIYYITKSLGRDVVGGDNQIIWYDDFHINCQHGHEVFDYEKKAVHSLEKVLLFDPNTNIHPIIQEVIDMLVAVDRQLALTEIGESDDQGDIDQAMTKFNQGEESDDPEFKIQKYRDGWNYVCRFNCGDLGFEDEDDYDEDD
ncbi:MAG: DUF4215 domain-containing protein, partial [Parcubacteria group bacterium]